MINIKGTDLIYVDTPNGMRYVRKKEWVKHKKEIRKRKLRVQG